jgi:AcrR family transcriptional regulator
MFQVFPKDSSDISRWTRYGGRVRDLRNAPRQARSSASVDAILDAAEQVFATLGTDAATTVDIAKAAGISVGRLYYWFPDKAAVASAAVARSEALVKEFLESTVVDDPTRSTAGIVEHIVFSMGAFARARPGTFALVANPGPDATAVSLHVLLVDLAATVVAARVPDSTPDERVLVSTTAVRTAIGMIVEYVSRSLEANDPDIGREYLQECVYLINAYFYVRYPANWDSVWDNPTYPIQPARRPRPNIPSGGVQRPMLGLPPPYAWDAPRSSNDTTPETHR